MAKSKNQNTKIKGNKRSKTKYPNLDPKLNLKTRHDLIKVDYLHKLNESELKFLDKFNAEYVNCKINRKRKRSNLHKSKEYIKDIDSRNNARNRCIITRETAQGTMNYTEEMVKKTPFYSNEEELNNKIDKDISKELFKNAHKRVNKSS